MQLNKPAAATSLLRLNSGVFCIGQLEQGEQYGTHKCHSIDKLANSGGVWSQSTSRRARRSTRQRSGVMPMLPENSCAPGPIQRAGIIPTRRRCYSQLAAATLTLFRCSMLRPACLPLPSISMSLRMLPFAASKETWNSAKHRLVCKGDPELAKEQAKSFGKRAETDVQLPCSFFWTPGRPLRAQMLPASPPSCQPLSLVSTGSAPIAPLP